VAVDATTCSNPFAARCAAPDRAVRWAPAGQGEDGCPGPRIKGARQSADL